jgi:simple sugar transport system ATP-binding protein
MSAPGVAIAGEGIAKSFGHINALINASIEVRRGEVVALFGDNGAGKSTLLRCLQGIHRPDRGTIIVDDKPVRLSSIRDAQAHGVECVHQDLSLAPDLSVVDNMFLGNEIMRPGLSGTVGVLDRRKMTERASNALKELSIELPSLKVAVRDLSGGQRQALAVARAVMWARTAVLMDEPTAALGAKQSEVVCDLIKTIAGRGLGVLVVSHDLPRILAIADRVVILWRGSIAANVPAHSITVPQAVATMVGYREEAA